MSPKDTALCNFAARLTHSPANMQQTDIQHLRDLGLGDDAIHDAVQVISYFNYINRVADALHVEQEPEIRHWEKPFGALEGISIMEKIRKIKSQHEKEWLGIDGVEAVGIGLTAGKIPGIIISVSTSPTNFHDQIPAEIEGIPIEIQETGTFRAY